MSTALTHADAQLPKKILAEGIRYICRVDVAVSVRTLSRHSPVTEHLPNAYASDFQRELGRWE